MTAEARMWLMWGRHGDSVDWLDIHSIVPTKKAVEAQGRKRGGQVVPLRMIEDPDGRHEGWVDEAGALEWVYPFMGERDAEVGSYIRLRAELLDVDLDDTTNCPQASSCFACTEVHDDDQLAVATYTTPVGVVCVTMCGDCVETGPDLSGWGGAVELALEHCGHLGITGDEAAALIEQEN